jgi:hypothetical protein
MHNTAANFEDPQRFWPERWLRKSGPGTTPEQGGDDADQLDRDPLARAFLPYSAGPRSCIGQPLAMMEVNGRNFFTYLPFGILGGAYLHGLFHRCQVIESCADKPLGVSLLVSSLQCGPRRALS